jgi:hypothetical protein
MQAADSNRFGGRLRSVRHCRCGCHGGVTCNSGTVTVSRVESGRSIFFEGRCDVRGWLFISRRVLGMEDQQVEGYRRATGECIDCELQLRLHHDRQARGGTGYMRQARSEW